MALKSRSSRHEKLRVGPKDDPKERSVFFRLKFQGQRLSRESLLHELLDKWLCMEHYWISGSDKPPYELTDRR